MPSKRVLVTAGVLAIAAGATAVAAHSYRGYHDGWRDGGHGGRWGREIAKTDYDAATRSRFAQMDANGDGVVDAGEVKGMMERRAERRRGHRGHRHMRDRFESMLRRFDENNDGKVSRAEFDERIEFMFARMDLDGDGRITDADLPPMMRGRGVLGGNGQMGRGHGQRGPGRMLRMLRGADANGDGEITREEAMAVAEQHFARLDWNKDGVIDMTDADALRAATIDYRVKRFFHRYGASQDAKLTVEKFKAERDRRFARWDVNKDNVLTRDEMPASGWMHGRRGAHGWGGGRGYGHDRHHGQRHGWRHGRGDRWNDDRGSDRWQHHDRHDGGRRSGDGPSAPRDEQRL
jgi:Ca2+-binding EF-hand superfamily protein